VCRDFRALELRDRLGTGDRPVQTRCAINGQQRDPPATTSDISMGRKSRAIRRRNMTPHLSSDAIPSPAQSE